MKVKQPAILKKLRRNQKGFTLIELLLVIALTGIIGAGATMSIHQVIFGTALSNDLNTAVNQVRNAGYWISRDALMAQSIAAENLTAPKVMVLDWVGLEWKEGSSGYECYNTYHIEYHYSDNKLERYQKITTDKYTTKGQLVETGESESTILVADYITSISIPDPALGAGKLVITIKAKYREAEEGRTYEIKPRPNA